LSPALPCPDHDEDDLDKIKIPIVTYDSAASEEQYQRVARRLQRDYRREEARCERLLFLGRPVGCIDQGLGSAGTLSGPARSP